MDKNSVVFGRGRGRGLRKPIDETFQATKVNKFETTLTSLNRLPIAKSVQKLEDPSKIAFEEVKSTLIDDGNDSNAGPSCSSKAGQCEPTDGTPTISRTLDNGVPKTKIEGAHEFRMDAGLSASPIAKHFFCCVCGCPAGHDCFTCESRGHPMCRTCQSELCFIKCPYVLKVDNQYCICNCKLLKLKSAFREFMLRNTIIGCLNREKGCMANGTWEEIKKHQVGCKYQEDGM